MDAVFRALAHADRRRMLDIIRDTPGCNVGEVCARFAMSRIGAMKHLGVLEAAWLVVSRKKGRTRRLYVNGAPLQMIHDRWLSEWSTLWAADVTRIKYRVESGGTAPARPAKRRRPPAARKKTGRRPRTRTKTSKR